MAENPSNFYNDNIKYANPPSGGCNWDLDYYRTNYINAVLLGQLKEGNYIKSGLVPTQGTGLDIDVTAGVAVIGGVEHSVNAFSIAVVVAPLGGVEFNLVYINSSGVAEVIQSDPAIIGCALAIVDTDDTAILRFMDARQLLQYDTTPNPVFQNYIVDGDFLFWYEGPSQTTSGYGSDTMWLNNNSGSTKTHSRQEFTVGQSDVPGNIDYFSRTVVTSVVGASNYCNKLHNIEDVKKLSDKNITFSFWAKADSAKNISIELVQDFGDGGSPSADVEGIGAQKIAITTSWAKYTVNVDMPSISGKTLGTDGNDHTKLLLWFDAGSDYNSRTDSLGQQSGTFDIARARIVEEEEDGDNINENFHDSLERVSRYYQDQPVVDIILAQYNDSYTDCQFVSFPVEMRSTPSCSIIISSIIGHVGTQGSVHSSQANKIGLSPVINWTNGEPGRAIKGRMSYEADSRL